MRRYRYRSPALVGPWRDTSEEAISDAIGAGQAHRSTKNPAEIVWHDAAHLEEQPKPLSFFTPREG